ncbi:mRNA turnover protein 4 homolog [Prorops nasuta]|uniref:mRNA turnover protein 4 homolog n=1 Tax=Prorops nasuta TaxID=863751 RepID=UPI0034CF1E38
MPKSKKDKKISLTKTSKKGVILKQRIIEDVRNCVAKYDRIFIILVQNMRNNIMQNVRTEWKDSRFIFGRNKVIRMALENSSEAEIAEGLQQLSKALKGQTCLLFTNRSKKEVLKWVAEYEELDYARSGFIPSESIVIPEGPMPQFSHSIEPHLRQLGMPTTLQKGVVTLLKRYKVCKKGQPLTPEQAKLLKLLEKQLTSFKLIPVGIYSKKHGFTEITQGAKENIECDMDAEISNNT